MITLFLLSLLATTILLGSIPFVLFGLMLETTAQRAQAHTKPALARIRLVDADEPLPSFQAAA